MVLQRIVKPKTQRAKRALEKRAPKLIENDKQTMYIRGGRTSETVTKALKDLYLLKKPSSVMFRRKNVMRPFDDQTQIEYFSKKYDASLFMFGSHSKKRPHNLVIGRLFSGNVLDMIELGIETHKCMADFKTPKCALATKPCLVFAGEPFDQDHEHRRLKNLFIDFFRGSVISQLRLQGLEHIMLFTAAEGKVYIRNYTIQMKKSGSRIPRIELTEMGPSLDLVVRRARIASDDLYKKARKVPKAAKVGKKKNVSRDSFGTKHGRIHMEKQDLGKLQTRKMKGLKRSASEKAALGGKRPRNDTSGDDEAESERRTDGSGSGATD